MSWFSRFLKRKEKKGNFNGLTNFTEAMTAEEEEKFIDRVAKNIVNRGMDAPALLFLEMAKPLSYLGGQLFQFSVPFLEVFNLEKMGIKYSSFFEKRENIERLIKKIEEIINSK